jgi:hypothetical protein
MARGVIVTGTAITAAGINAISDPPRCRLTHASAQSTTSGTGLALLFDTEVVDDGGLHSTSSNTSRITIPSDGGGFYVINGNVEFASNATGHRQLAVRLNGSTTIANVRIPAVNGAVTIVSISTMYSLADGDYIELLALQSSGGALNVNSTGDYSPIFSAVWVAVP